MGEQPVKDNSATPVVTGRILISSLIPAFHNAAVHVRLEDVSYPDRRASVVAETILPDISHQPSGADGGRDTEMLFTIETSPEDAANIQSQNEYTVRVWVDIDGDGKRGPGDLYSTEQHRVLTRGFGSKVAIHLDPR